MLHRLNGLLDTCCLSSRVASQLLSSSAPAPPKALPGCSSGRSAGQSAAGSAGASLAVSVRLSLASWRRGHRWMPCRRHARCAAHALTQLPTGW